MQEEGEVCDHRCLHGIHQAQIRAWDQGEGFHVRGWVNSLDGATSVEDVKIPRWRSRRQRKRPVRLLTWGAERYSRPARNRCP